MVSRTGRKQPLAKTFNLKLQNTDANIDSWSSMAGSASIE